MGRYTMQALREVLPDTANEIDSLLNQKDNRIRELEGALKHSNQMIKTYKRLMEEYLSERNLPTRGVDIQIEENEKALRNAKQEE